jgi:hypothetical protein
LNFPYTGGPAGCCGFNQPSFDLANSFRTVAGLPILDGTHNSPANELKTDQGVTAEATFVPDAGPLDPRLDFSVGRRGIPISIMDYIQELPGSVIKTTEDLTLPKSSYGLRLKKQVVELIRVRGHPVTLR